MLDTQLRTMIDEVKDGRMDRRGFVQRMLAFGLTAPMATQILAIGGVAMAEGPSVYKPTKRGGGGALKLLWWQGPTLLNPHFATGTKDQDGSRLFYEPLACWDADGNMKLVLAAEIPSLQNGGLAADGMSVTWKLKPGVKWHDGKPFTADDVVFNWEYARDPATATVTIGSSPRHHSREGRRPHRPHPVQEADAVLGRCLCRRPRRIIPKHLFADYKGAKSREAPNNLSPVGTGPYKFVEFKPGDLIRGELNPDYHMPNRPHFDTIEMKGGGDAVSAARAVIQTGEYDFGWNIQVEDDVLLRLEKGGKGKTVYAVGGDTEFIALNFTDPNTEVDGERSSIKTKHPLLSDPAVRKALSMLVDREAIKKVIYGRAGRTTRQLPQRPRAVRLQEHDLGIQHREGVQAAGGRRLEGRRRRHPRKGRQEAEALYQTAINGPRQKTQAIVKQACQKAGIDVELKSVVASVFFSSDVANPDTYAKFYADIEMFQIPMSQPDPAQHMRRFIRATSPPRRTSGRASISRAGSTRTMTRRSTPPRPRPIPSSAPRSTSRPTTSCGRTPCSSP